MPIYLLGKKPVFPPPQLATSEGIIAAGGDLSPQRLLNAYASGIFPWYSEGEPILWWSPNPRLVLLPGNLHISKSMKKLLKKNRFHITYDRNFRKVVEGCSLPRVTQPGTWISKEIREAYTLLHQLGFAHSVEVWDPLSKELAGGLYGVSLGRCFFGESMFYKQANASKYGFIKFFHQLFKSGFTLVDCQVASPHLKTLGCIEIPRKQFLTILKNSLTEETLKGKWTFLEDNPEY